MPSLPKILVVTDNEAELTTLQKTFDTCAVFHNARDVNDLARIWNLGVYDAVFCGTAFAKNEAWMAILPTMRDVPLIVFSDDGGEGKWKELLETGALELLSVRLQSKVISIASGVAAQRKSNKLRRHAADALPLAS
jgi:hypothetical protein